MKKGVRDQGADALSEVRGQGASRVQELTPDSSRSELLKPESLIAVLGIRGFPGVQGGVETHCQHLYPPMTQYRFRVYRRLPYLTAQSLVTYDNIEFVDWRSTRIQGFEATWHTVRAMMHCVTHRPALVHVHNMGPALLALPLRWLGIPVVMTYHSINYEHRKWGRVARWWLRQSERLSLRHCDRVIFVNRLRMEHFDEQVQHKSIYIPNGAQAAQPTTATNYLLRHNITPGEYVLSVGRITPEKGLEHLIEAANRSSVIRQVVIAGESDHNTDYLKQLKALDTSHKVIFTGYATDDNLCQLYSHARLLALPSLSEGFPMALLEAMSYRLPIVASDIEATRLVSLPTQNYCQPGDMDALRGAIERQLSQPSGPVDYDLKQHDWEAIAQRTAAVYDELLNNGR